MFRSLLRCTAALAVLAGWGATSCHSGDTEPFPVQAPLSGQTPLDALPPSLQLVQIPVAGSADEVQVELQFQPQPLAPRPRAMELFLRVSSNLTLLSASAGSAATAAAKQVSAWSVGEGKVRVMVSADNIVSFDGGPLVELRFRRSGGPATVTLSKDKPIFSPAPADAAVILGEPLQIR